MSRNASTVLKQLDRVFNRGTVLGLSEGSLLERYVTEYATRSRSRPWSPGTGRWSA